MSLRDEIENILKKEESLINLHYDLQIEQSAAIVNPATQFFRLDSAELIYAANRNIKSILNRIETMERAINDSKIRLKNNIGDLINKPLIFVETIDNYSAPQKLYYLVALDEDGVIEVSKRVSP